MLCEKAKEDGITKLYDNFEIDRGKTLEIFKSVGFVIDEEQKWKKFGSTSIVNKKFNFKYYWF